MPGVHLEVPNNSRVSRNDSFKSERSDKRVSFNNDVGVKRIPRGQRPTSHHPAVKSYKDEWSNCAPVHLEKPNLSSTELERQAEDLVKLLDQVECVSGNKPVTHHLPKSGNKNNKNRDINRLNNIQTKNNLVNGPGSPYRNNAKKFENTRTRNPINSSSKEDINILKRDRVNVGSRPLMRRSLSAHPSTNDINDSDTDNTYEKYSATYKSVPDIPTTIHYNNYNKPYDRFNHLINHDIGERKNFTSVDNIYNENERLKNKAKRNRNYNEYKSVDNLTDISIPGNRKLHEYKSVENLQSGYSSGPNDFEMTQTSNYRPQVGSMIKKFNAGADEQRERVHTIMIEENPPRKYKEPDNYHFHNNNKPFSYTGAPLSSVEAVRRLSPSRDLPDSDALYAKVNKGRDTRSNSREKEANFRNNNNDFSAKIIITNDDHTRYDGDDDAYETYQVGENNFAKQIRELNYSNEYMDDYKGYSNNNMIMSSVGVQTEKYPKIPSRSRKNQNSPSRYEYGQKEGYNNDLSSASLVRRINHGFGKIDRSPSPPPRIVASHRKVPRNVVPLLSDTDDSEFNYRGRSDPMARIRDQVRIRDKLQEEREAEEREAREEEFFTMRKSLDKLDSSRMQPLTVDDVGVLPLEVDQRGRNSLIVSRQGHSSSTSRMAHEHHGSYKNETNERVHSAPPRSRSSNEGYSRDLSPRPMSTLERMKKSIEKGKSSLDRSDSKLKEKKKKKIKIKFYYDPKHQENNKEDPLNKYTEYKGTSSDERSSPTGKYVDYASDPYDSYYRGSKNELRDDFHRSLLHENYSERRNRSRTNLNETYQPPRAPRKPSRESSREKDRDHSRSSRHERESSNERSLRRGNYETRESRNNRLQPANKGIYYDSSIDRRERKSSRENLRGSHDFLDNYQKRETNIVHSRDESTHKRFEHTTGNKFYDSSDRSDIHKDNRYKVSNSYDGKDSPDHGVSLSDKYRSLTRHSSPPRDPKSYNSNINKVEDEKQEKILRQRNKFLGVLMGEGRNKGVSSTHETKGESSTLPRTTPQKKTSSSNTLQRIDTTLTHKDNLKKDREQTKITKESKPKQQAKKRKKRQWPWSFLGLRGASRSPEKGGLRSKTSSRASSRASSVRSSKISSKPSRPTLRAVKIRRAGYESRPYTNRERVADSREKHQWESATLNRNESKKQEVPTRLAKSPVKDFKYSADSSPSSTATPVGRVGRTPSFKQRYFGDSDRESGRMKPGIHSTGGDYRSLPNRKTRNRGSRLNVGPRRGVGGRAISPGNQGSAGSSLQSSESEADSHGGSHASKHSRASHVSTGSNRSVFLHATAVADIPVRRGSDETPSERGLSRSSKKVSKSFSLLSPWKPRHYREKYEVEYDNREVREARSRNALPPRPPRKQLETEPQKVGRSQTVYKDSKLTGWLKRKKNKEIKGI